MIAIMLGSSIFKMFVVKLHVIPENLGKYIFSVAAFSLAIPVVTTVCNQRLCISVTLYRANI